MVNWWRELGCCYHFECIWKSLFHFVVAVKAPLMVNWWREVGRQILYGDTQSSWIYPYSLASLVQQLAISCKRSWLLRWLPSISSNFWVDLTLFSVLANYESMYSIHRWFWNDMYGILLSCKKCTFINCGPENFLFLILLVLILNNTAYMIGASWRDHLQNLSYWFYYILTNKTTCCTSIMWFCGGKIV